MNCWCPRCGQTNVTNPSDPLTDGTHTDYDFCIRWVRYSRALVINMLLPCGMQPFPVYSADLVPPTPATPTTPALLLNAATLTYVPGNPANWAGSPPATIQAALDRIAAALGSVP